MKLSRRVGCCAIILVVIATTLGLAACVLAASFGQLQDMLPSLSYDLPGLPTYTGVVFADEFNSQDRSSALGWSFGGSQEVERTWSGGHLNVTIRKVNGGSACYVNRALKDFGVEIEAEAEGKPGIEYGLAFRYSLSYGRASLYEFMVTSDGKYFMYKFFADRVTYKKPAELTTSPLVKGGGSSNRIGVLAEGDKISLYVNGHLVRTVTDDSLSNGTIAIFVNGGPNDQVRVSFNRIVIYTVERAKSELAKQ